MVTVKLVAPTTGALKVGKSPGKTKTKLLETDVARLKPALAAFVAVTTHVVAAEALRDAVAIAQLAPVNV